MPNEMIKAAFGNNADIDIDNVGKQIPAVGTGSVLGSEECKKRCKISN
jgi:hypothetical protein